MQVRRKIEWADSKSQRGRKRKKVQKRDESGF